LSKLGLKTFPGIEKVVVRTKQGGQTVTFVMENPDILKSNETFVIFGEPKVQDNQNQANLQAAAAALARGVGKEGAGDEEPPVLEEVHPKEEKTGTHADKPAHGAPASTTTTQEKSAATSTGAPGTGAVDESGVDAKDIELVVAQAACTREKAIEALKAAKGDVVDAIMKLMK